MITTRRDRSRRRAAWIAAAALTLFAGVPASAACVAARQDAPRTLILALDGVPFRAMESAREQGAFTGWPAARPLVAPFPSMTNVGFVAILRPLGAERIRGYETRHYDPERNEVWGGGLPSKGKSFGWKDLFQVISRGNYAKARIYITPRSKSLDEMDQVERLVLDAPTELMTAHVAATDSLTHFHGDDRLVGVLLKISRRVDELRELHLERFGRPLRVVVLSDHGNTLGKIREVEAIPGALRRAGLRPSGKLRGRDDVVPVTYGICGYGALYTDTANAERAARAVVEAEGVDLVAWRAGGDSLRLLSPRGEARIDWRLRRQRRFFRYVSGKGDPLHLGPVSTAMSRDGLLDAQGWGSEQDWFARTADGDYPDPLTRLVDSLAGTYVDNPATVIFSLEPGYAWGVRSARVGAWMRGGALEATHGGLDRESTLGFYLRSDSEPPPGPIHAERALDEFAELAACLHETAAGALDVTAD